ncbi:MAG: AAA family ATPase [Alphaproteobacteria bacterium]|nr:MAG: AAA family ATPase [Alphaproteobacteria bacterium]
MLIFCLFCREIPDIHENSGIFRGVSRESGESWVGEGGTPASKMEAAFGSKLSKTELQTLAFLLDTIVEEKLKSQPLSSSSASSKAKSTSAVLVEEEEEFKKTLREKLTNPEAVFAFLNEEIDGQKEAKEVLSNALYYHFTNRFLHNNYDEVYTSLLLGPSGSGKTASVKRLAKFLDLPFVEVDATNLTPSGWAGDDIEKVVASRLALQSGGNPSKARRAIVFIDEVDKLRIKPGDKDGQHLKEGAQQALLKLLEGKKIVVSGEEVDTRDILFICAGSFPGLTSLIAKRAGGVDAPGRLQEFQTKDLQDYGFIVEFLGRIFETAVLDALDKDGMKRVLKKLIKKRATTLKDTEGVALTFESGAEDEIVNRAFNDPTGARVLSRLLKKVMHEDLFKIQDYKSKTLTITQAKVKSSLGIS